MTTDNFPPLKGMVEQMRDALERQGSFPVQGDLAYWNFTVDPNGVLDIIKEIDDGLEDLAALDTAVRDLHSKRTVIHESMDPPHDAVELCAEDRQLWPCATHKLLEQLKQVRESS